MPLFDLFGVKKDLRPEEDVLTGSRPAAPVPGPAPSGKGSRRGWGIALALNTLLVLGASGVLATRVIDHLSATPAVTAPRPAPKGEKAPGPAAPQAAAKPEKAPEAKPADPPKKPAPPPAPEAKAPEKKAPAAKPAGKPATRPVPFTYTGNGAKEVALVGPFLVRTGGRKQMFKNSKGAWQLTIYLNIGESYKYRFEVTDSQGRKKLTPAETVEVLQP